MMQEHGSGAFSEVFRVRVGQYGSTQFCPILDAMIAPESEEHFLKSIAMISRPELELNIL